jgi:hypothetical protein
VFSTGYALQISGNRARIFKLLWSPRNRFQGINSASLMYSLAGRYDNLNSYSVPSPPYIV